MSKDYVDQHDGGYWMCSEHACTRIEYTLFQQFTVATIV